MKYEAQKGQRIKGHGFVWVTNFCGYWWVHAQQKWVHRDQAVGLVPRSSSFNGVRSVRAFRRHLKKWRKYLPAGIEFILVSRWRGHDIHARLR